jgi:hypothetical protein
MHYSCEALKTFTFIYDNQNPVPYRKYDAHSCECTVDSYGSSSLMSVRNPTANLAVGNMLLAVPTSDLEDGSIPHSL